MIPFGHIGNNFEFQTLYTVNYGKKRIKLTATEFLASAIALLNSGKWSSGE